MNEGFINSIVTVLLALIGVAIIAVLVSKNADTSNVLRAGGESFGGILKTAISPVTSSGIFGSGGANYYN